VIVSVFVLKACSDVIIDVFVDLDIGLEVRLYVDFGLVGYGFTLDFVPVVV
jgi:hypothetical protein